MGYQTWRSNTNLIYTDELTVGVTPILAGPLGSIIDNVTVKAATGNAGIVYVTWQNAGATQRYALYKDEALEKMRVTGFDVFRVYASAPGQVLHVYAELGESSE